MKSLLVYLKEYKKESILAPIFKMLEAVLELFVPIVMAAVIDNGITNSDKGYVLKMCILLIGLACVGLVCSITAQYFAAKAAVGFGTDLRKFLFHHIQGLSFSEMDTVGPSTLITRMTSDINQVQAGVNMVLRLFLRSPFIVFGAVVMSFTISVQEALVFAVTIPVLSVIIFGIMMITMPLYKKVQAGLDKILGITRQNLTGVRVIRAFGNEQNEIRNFEESNQFLTSFQKFVGKISGLMNPLTFLVINFAIIVLLWVGALNVNVGSITQGQLIALISYMTQILVELIKLANLIISVTKSMACAQRIESIFKVKSSMKDGTISISEYRDSKGDIPAVEFRNVSLTYNQGAEESLSNVTFTANRGETIGIIGGTGSGKSSLVNLIPRFYDATSGQVLINGIDVKKYKLKELREHIGMVMQKAVLFKGSIRENLLWGKKDAGEEEIQNALNISQAEEFVKDKENGLESYVDQAGKNLSGGQKQRLTIARAVIKNPMILILDDSASALDFATDAKLRKSIREIKNKPAVFIVSQRTSSIQYADKILVLDEGKIVGIGKHEDLLKNCEVYQEIYYSQIHNSDADKQEERQERSEGEDE